MVRLASKASCIAGAAAENESNAALGAPSAVGIRPSGFPWRRIGGMMPAMPRDPYIRDKFTREVNHARQKAKDYFAQYPKDLFEAEVESWRDLKCSNIEFTMKRLREPKPS